MFRQPVKYIIRDGKAIILSPALTHKELAGYQTNIEGAGFVSFGMKVDDCNNHIPVAHVYGRSESLDIDSRLEDADIINRQIFNH